MLLLLSLLTLSVAHAALSLRRGDGGVVVQRGGSLSISHDTLTDNAAARTDTHSARSHKSSGSSVSVSVSSEVSEPLLGESEREEDTLSHSLNTTTRSQSTSTQGTHTTKKGFSVAHAYHVCVVWALRRLAHTHMLTVEEVLVAGHSLSPHNAHSQGEKSVLSDFSLSVGEMERALLCEQAVCEEALSAQQE